MSAGPFCNQDSCNEPAAYLFTWPGREEAGICEDHSVLVTGVAQTMGFAVELRPIAGRARADNTQRLAGVYGEAYAKSYLESAESPNTLWRHLLAHCDGLAAVYELDR